MTTTNAPTILPSNQEGEDLLRLAACIADGVPLSASPLVDEIDSDERARISRQTAARPAPQNGQITSYKKIARSVIARTDTANDFNRGFA